MFILGVEIFMIMIIVIQFLEMTGFISGISIIISRTSMSSFINQMRVNFPNFNFGSCTSAAHYNLSGEVMSLMDQTTSRIVFASDHSVKNNQIQSFKSRLSYQNCQLMKTYVGPDLQVFSLKFQMSISPEEGVPALVPPMKATSQSLIWT